MMSIRDSVQKMRADIRSAYKSEDTEEFFDRIFTKPLGYLWALLFMKLNWTPNMVTLLSMGIGFAGGLLFYPDHFSVNLIGVLLMIWANILDSTDGQLARLTGNKSTLGRILDALSTGVWYLAIYCALCLRLTDTPIPFSGGKPWGGWIWALALLCAFFGHGRQCMLADYYRNIHLYFLKNKNGSELDSSAEIAKTSARLPWKGARFQKTYLYLYGMYTYIQELSTPAFQKLRKGIAQTGGEPDAQTREDYLNQSRKYIQLTNVLTFNARAYTLFACVLLGVPLLYFPIELFVFGGLLSYMRDKYEAIATDVLYAHRLPGSEIPPVKRKRYPAVFFAIGVLGVALMLIKTDLSAIDWSAIVSKMPIWLPSLIALWAAIYLVHTLAYRVIIGGDAKGMRLLYLYKVTLSGFALNHVTPVGLVGGEPYRIMELKPYLGAEKAAATTITFTVMHVFSHIMFWLTGAILFFLVVGASGGILPMLAAALMLAGCALACWAFFRSGKRGLVLPTLRLLSRIPWAGAYIARWMEKKKDSLEAIDREMGAFHTRKRSFWATVALEYAGRALEVAEYYLIFKILGVNVSFAQCFLALSCASLIGNLMFFVPMQVGSREGGLALSLGWMGVASSFGVTASLLARIREIFYIALGVGIMLIKGSTRAPEAAEDEKSGDGQS